MTDLVCHIFDGSPFSRMVRVLARERGVPMTEDEVGDYPPDPALMQVNPPGQAPVLAIAGRGFFPTDIALAAPGDAVGAAQPVPAPLRLSGQDMARRQIGSVVLSMGDQIVARCRRRWAGPAPHGSDRPDLDLDARALGRIVATLAWLMLRTESRGPIPWRGRPRIAAIIDALSMRAGFAATAPRPCPL